MNLTTLAEQGYLPDWLIRVGMRRLLRRRLRQERSALANPARAADFVRRLRSSPVALATEAANAQHYEVPAEFFEAMLGPRMKYSCCLYEEGRPALADAEEAMLRLTCLRADLHDGMDVLELGCGWGSLTLWIAQRFPRCRVTALSNSTGQRRFIEARCRARGLDNVRVLTANMADFTGAGAFDRIVSVEMFEHMRNYEQLLQRLHAWLRPEGKLFVHLFCHREFAYTFETDGEDNWMGRHFFTGGMMPSYSLLDQFNRDLVVRRRWQVDGRHYARTCEDWLANLDANRSRLLRLLEGRHSPAEARIALQRWRMFVMACAELFGCRDGAEWFVGHFLLEPRHTRSALAPSPNGDDGVPVELETCPVAPREKAQA